MDRITRKRLILFVDDEPNILKGLGRMLRSMKHEWDVDFSESGSQAIEMLKEKPYDVVVSDMRMPGMDGLKLLDYVQKHFPLIVRIVLSGHSEQELILKSVRSAHQYLSKPCNSDILISTVSKSCKLRDYLSHESLRQVITQTETLPSLPSLYSRIMDELKSNNTSVEKLGEIIEQDIGMAAKMVQLVNSSFFGLPSHVSSPARAVVLLGMDTVKSLILTIGLFSQFDDSPIPLLDLEAIFEHSMNTGSLAQKISIKEGLSKDEVDDSFMAGLLHDLGKLIIISNFPNQFQKVLDLSAKKEKTFIQVESEIIGASHCAVGAYLLGLWGFSETIIESVAYHHEPQKISHKKFTPLTAVYLANILENSSGFHKKTPYIQEELDENYLAELGLNGRIKDYKELVEDLKSEQQDK